MFDALPGDVREKIVKSSVAQVGASLNLVHASEHARDFSCMVTLGLGRLRN